MNVQNFRYIKMYSYYGYRAGSVPTNKYRYYYYYDYYDYYTVHYLWSLCTTMIVVTKTKKKVNLVFYRCDILYMV